LGPSSSFRDEKEGLRDVPSERIAKEKAGNREG
jgi:hypothetical protein